MHIAASPVWDAWSELSTRLPADLDLDELARTSQAILRHRDNGVSDGASLLRLSLARGPGGKSLQDTAVWARLNGVAELTGQSLNERLHRSVAFLAAITHRLLAGQSPGRPLLWSGRCLRIADGSCLSQPGSTGTDWRLHGVYDLGRGGFSHLELTDRHGAESLLRCDPGRRDLRRLPAAVAGRAGVQAAEIAAPYRPITHPHGGGQPELAVCPPDPGSADRRHLPGVPGLFPLSRLLRVAAARCGGRSNWRSTLCSAGSPASRWPPS
jgi:hypothetical protein